MEKEKKLGSQKARKRQKQHFQRAYFCWNGIQFFRMGNLLSLILFLDSWIPNSKIRDHA